MTEACRSMRHQALFYRGDTEYLDGIIPFLEEGLDRGEPIAVAVPARNLLLIEKALETRSGAVRLIDMERAGRNPGAILPGVLFAFAGEHPGPARIVGEPIWRERSALEYPACAQHEALINDAFADRPVTVLCAYDAADLDPAVLTDAERTHPVLRCPGHPGGLRPSPAFDPAGVVADFNLPLGSPLAAVRYAFDRRRLATVRGFAELWAARHGLRRPRRDDFVLAVAELTTNSVLYGGGKGVLRLWRADDHAVGEITDGGTLSDPLAGRVPVAPGRPGGRGLVLVNRLADLVRTYWIPGSTTTRIYFSIAGAR